MWYVLLSLLLWSRTQNVGLCKDIQIVSYLHQAQVYICNYSPSVEVYQVSMSL